MSVNILLREDWKICRILRWLATGSLHYLCMGHTTWFWKERKIHMSVWVWFKGSVRDWMWGKLCYCSMIYWFERNDSYKKKSVPAVQRCDALFSYHNMWMQHQSWRMVGWSLIDGSSQGFCSVSLFVTPKWYKRLEWLEKETMSITCLGFLHLITQILFLISLHR